MTESFKQQLQELVDRAAENKQNENWCALCRESFKQGCEFLMPMIESLIDIRNSYIEHRTDGPYLAEELRNRNDRDFLQLLKDLK